MSQQWRQGTQLVLPVGVHRWQPPPPWSPKGCLCAPCTVHTNTQDAGFLSSARSLGSDLQLCGSQTWCCQHACISVWQSSSVRPSSTGSSSFAYCQHLSQLPGMHAAPYSWTVAPREPGNAASLPSASAFTTTLWPSKQNSPWAGLWGSAEHPQNPLSLASVLGPLSHELLQLEETAKFKRNQRETVGGLLDPMKEYRSGDSLLVVPAQMSHIKTKLLNQIHSGVLSARTEDLNSHFLNNCQYTKASCSKLAVLEVISPKIKIKTLFGLKLKSPCKHWLTCLLRVMALGWHFVQMPSGQGGCPSQPDLILQLMFSRATNFPLQEGKEKAAVNMVTASGSHKS